jgi:hypothetical protein
MYRVRRQILLLKNLHENPDTQFHFLWTGVLPYVPYRSLSISKLFCKDGRGGGGVEGFVMNSQGISEGRGCPTAGG